MLDKLKSIATGWKNYMVPNPVAETIATERAEICAPCPEAVESAVFFSTTDERLPGISGLTCALCKCPLSAKTRSPLESCPLYKW